MNRILSFVGILIVCSWFGIQAETFSSPEAIVKSLSHSQSVAEAQTVLTRFLGPPLPRSKRFLISSDSELPISQFLFALRKKQVRSLNAASATAILLHAGFEMSELNAFYETHDEFLKQSFRKKMFAIALLQLPIGMPLLAAYAMSDRVSLAKVIVSHVVISSIFIIDQLIDVRFPAFNGRFSFDLLGRASKWSKLASARDSRASIGAVPLRCFEALVRAGSTRE